MVGGRYRIERQLGAGGFGVVYLATQLPLNRPVAVKVLSQSGPDANARFAQEAALAQRLEHPHTVRIIDFGIAETGEPFIVWEYLRGQTLGEHLAAHGPLPIHLAQRVTVQILKSLMEAHALGIIHRDIKPANIFLSSHPGEPVFAKVLDFGIAKDLFAPGNTLFDAPTRTLALHSESSKPGSMTSASQLLGTPRYMSPEQARGQPVGPETDLYALGLVVCEMLTGRPVFEDESAFDVLVAQGSDAPTPISPDLTSTPLGPIILRATQKSRERRFASAAEMLALLEAAPLAQAPVTPHLPSPTALPAPPTVHFTETPRARAGAAARPSRIPWLIAAGALAVAATAIVVMLTSLSAPAKKKTAPTSKATATSASVSATPADPLFLPPPPNVDWTRRRILSFEAAALKEALVKGGYEVRKVERIDQPTFQMATFAVAKPPCGGSVLIYRYGDTPTADLAAKTLAETQHGSRVLREGNGFLQVALSRLEHPEGDPACSDPAALVLTKEP
jgi:serine/threonine protein kinase